MSDRGVSYPETANPYANAPCQLDPELWYVEESNREARALRARAKQTCRESCPMVANCLAGALQRGEQWGVWGGLDADERRALTRGRAS